MIAGVSVSLTTLKKMVNVLEIKKQEYLNLTIKTSDKLDKNKQHVYVSVSQSEEERMTKKPEFTIAYGRVLYVGDTIPLTFKEIESNVPRVSEPIRISDKAFNDFKNYTPDLPF